MISCIWIFEKCADKLLSRLNYYEKRLTCKAYWVIVVLCWNLFCSCLVLFLFLSSPICHFPISCLMTAGSSSIITFTELSANVRGNSILLNHRESGLEKLQNVQKLARWFTALKYCWGVLFEHALPLYCRIIIEMRHGIYGWYSCKFINILKLFIFYKTVVSFPVRQILLKRPNTMGSLNFIAECSEATVAFSVVFFFS